MLCTFSVYATYYISYASSIQFVHLLVLYYGSRYYEESYCNTNSSRELACVSRFL